MIWPHLHGNMQKGRIKSRLGLSNLFVGVRKWISPFETALLDALAQAPYPARNVLNIWPSL